VTTDLTIHDDHFVAVVGPDTGPKETAVVSAQAPLHTVGPGIGYVVVQGAVKGVVLVEQ
jgi:hypothetical protein